MYGTGASSWCPTCHEAGGIVWSVGQLPDPQLYGQWFTARQTPSPGPPVESNPLAPLHRGGLTMKTKHLHSGPYCCPSCCVDYELVAEAILKCDQCSGPLVSGSVDDYFAESDDEPPVA
jgi:hypothetical protein